MLQLAAHPCSPCALRGDDRDIDILAFEIIGPEQLSKRTAHGYRLTAITPAVVNQGLTEWLTIVGFPATLVALLVGIQQAWQARRNAGKAKDAAEAAQDAAQRTERRIADNQLLLMIPQMASFRRELDLAVDQALRQDTLRLLGDWPILAAELRGILEQIDGDGKKKLIDDLRRSSRLTGKAKDAIIGGNEDLVPATEKARGLINDICSESSEIVGTMKAFTRSIGQ